MITKVRIAPVEQWCRRALKDLEAFPASEIIIGRWIEIITESMDVDMPYCGPGGPDEPGTKSWRVSNRTRSEVIAAVNEDRGEWVCEHMLEMD